MIREFLGIWIPAEIWLNKSITLSTKALLAEIESLGGSKAGCFADNDHLGLFMDVSGKTISNMLSDLKARGFIRIETKPTGRLIYLTDLFPKSGNVPEIREVTSRNPGTGVPEIRVDQYYREKGEYKEREGTLPLPGLSLSDELLAYWNKNSNLPQIKVLNRARLHLLTVRSKDRFWFEHWRQAIDRMAASSFCTGSNDRGWMATIDWFLQSNTVAKIIEGKYDNRKTNGHNRNRTSAEIRNSQIIGAESTAAAIRRELANPGPAPWDEHFKRELQKSGVADG